MLPRRLSISLSLLLATALSSVGCQSVPKGPGVLVTVRAEPKKGYVPPEDPDQGYGGTDSAPPQPAGHAFHRIDYHRLDGVLVWVEPLDDAARSSAATATPMNAVVEVDPAKPARAEDFQVASVGGRISLSGPPPKSGKAYIVRTESGALAEVAPGGQGYAAGAPGLVEVLSDDSDDPLATAYVAPTAWARKTAQGQRVAMPLPPARYRVTVWHPILPGGSQDTEVPAAAGPMTPLTLTFGVNSLPKPR
jgi:hypothetical protein